MTRIVLALLPLTLSATAFGQWTDVQKLGTGGETYVSTDGKGNVYATSHEPGMLYSSHDFGKTFPDKFALPDCMCDVCSTVAPDGRLYIAYIRPGVTGMQVVTSSDQGKSIREEGSLMGKFDREWIVVQPASGEVGFDYSDGYIGGPKSKGIFYAASTDQGKTFKTVSRVDKEPEGSWPVDPYLTIGSGGRIYAAWAVASKDYDHIDSYKMAESEDGGKTWINHTTIGTTHAAFGDTQERWMLGTIATAGKDTAMMVYEDYLDLGQDVRPLIAFYRITTDGGKTWSSAKPCLTPAEIKSSMDSFSKANGASGVVKNYCQTLPWLCADAAGNFHLAFVDNRDGSAEVATKKVSAWQVRMADWDPTVGKFGPSERVSADWSADRPPLDFLSCCADDKNVWVTWTENANRIGGWDFSGDFYIGHKTLK